jgi:hypothetical protein
MLRYHTLRPGLIPTPKTPPPFLDIDEILTQEKWKIEYLSVEETRTVKDTLQFFDLVTKGSHIAIKTAQKRILSANSSAINAFNIASKGYRQLNIKNKIEFSALIEKTELVLLSILSFDNRKDKFVFSAEDLSLTRNFIRSIGKVIQSQTYTP